MISLKELVQLYRSKASVFGVPVALSAFPWADKETERIFSDYEEDYHIGRFFHFSDADGKRYSINGVPATHVSLDSEIETIL